MIKKFTLLLSAFIALCSLAANAQIQGAELEYSLRNDSLIVRIKAYTTVNEKSNISTPIYIKADNSTAKPFNTKLLSTKDVSQICANGCSRFTDETCEFEYTLIESTLEAVVDLNKEFSETNCKLLISWYGCCRGQESNKLYIDAEIKRCGIKANNSPVFNSQPTQLHNVNEQNSQSWSATDADGDSLFYSFITSKISNVTNFSYSNGLSYDAPLSYSGMPNKNASFPKGFHINSSTGLVQFVPTKIESSPIAIKVEEFRNKEKIGEVIRDINQIIVAKNNTTPIVTGVNGNTKSSIELCAGSNSCFEIKTEDLDSKDKLEISWSHNIPGASVKLTSGVRPLLTVCVASDANQIYNRPYLLTVTVTDNNCQLPLSYTREIKVSIKQPFHLLGSAKIIGCKQVSFSSNLGNDTQYEYNWNVDNTEFTGSRPIVDFDQFGLKKYSLKVVDNLSNCEEIIQGSINIPESKKVALGTDISVCPNTDVKLTATGVTSYKWLTNEFGSNNKPSLVVNLKENREFIVEGTDVNGCKSNDTIKVEVKENTLQLSAASDIVCQSDVVTLSVDGGSNFTWSPKGLISNTQATGEYQFFEDETVEVSGTDDNGCISKVTKRVSVDKDCVWPGDVNGDGIVNNYDVLPIGIAFDEKFENTIPRNTAWKPTMAKNWLMDFSTGRNYKHADANGNGSIGIDDILVIDNNYAFESPKNLVEEHTNKKDEEYQLYFETTIVELKQGKRVKINVSLGSEVTPVKDIYGIAFSISASGLKGKIDSLSFNTDHSWLKDKQSNLLQFVKPYDKTGDTNNIDIALSRTGKDPISGHGTIGTLEFVVTDAIDLLKIKNPNLALIGVKANDQFGLEIPTYGDKYFFTPTSIQNATSNSFTMYPNPSTGIVHFQTNHDNIQWIKVLDLTGKVLQTNYPKSDIATLDLSQFHGVYIIQLSTNLGVTCNSLILE